MLVRSLPIKNITRLAHNAMNISATYASLTHAVTCNHSLLLAGAATSMIFVATKHVFCGDKSMLAGRILNTHISFV